MAKKPMPHGKPKPAQASKPVSKATVAKSVKKTKSY